MNEENERVTGGLSSQAVPLENKYNSTMFQSAGGPGRALPSDAIYREGGGAATTLATEFQPDSQTAPTNSSHEASAVGMVDGKNGQVTESPKARVSAVDPKVPTMHANPNVELKPIHLTDDSNLDPEEYEEFEEYEVANKTDVELELEKRNVTGLRFIIIFGLIVLLFILLLPFVVTLF